MTNIQAGEAFATDMVERKMYFKDGKDIYRAKFDGTAKEIVMKNADPRWMAIDWIGRRLFWVSTRTVEMSTLKGKDRRTVVKSGMLYDLIKYIVVDPIKG